MFKMFEGFEMFKGFEMSKMFLLLLFINSPGCASLTTAKPKPFQPVFLVSVV